MKNLFIREKAESISTSPTVDFNAETGLCFLSGESFMENSYEFYDPVFEWIKNYFKENDNLEIISKITYLNSSSKKAIYELFRLLKDYQKKGKSVSLRWYYVQEDSSMEDDLTMISNDIGLEIELAAIEGTEVLL